MSTLAVTSSMPSAPLFLPVAHTEQGDAADAPLAPPPPPPPPHNEQGDASNAPAASPHNEQGDVPLDTGAGSVVNVIG